MLEQGKFIKEQGMKNYKEEILEFLDFLWQEDTEIEFINLINEYRDRIETASDGAIKDYLRRVYAANEGVLMVRTSESFMNLLEDLLN